MPHRLPNYATRTTLFNCEALKSRRLYQEAAVHFIKMTSEVGSSFLLVTSQSFCHMFLAGGTPTRIVAAFLLVCFLFFLQYSHS